MKIHIFLLFFSLSWLNGNAQNNVPGWVTTTGKIEEKEFLGRKALFLNRGMAYMPNSTFDNGVIEVDMATPLMAGLTFRGDTNYNYEEVYIRYPKSGGLDAVQYGPCFNGEFSWQFYPEYQAKNVFPANQWIHMKIIVKDRKAAVYLLNQDTATLLIDSLRGANTSGHVGFWALNEGAYFTNLKYRAATEQETLPPMPVKIIRNPDAIKSWVVSEPMGFVSLPDTLEPPQLKHLQWQKTITEPDGYLNINKYARKKTWGKTRDNSNDMVWLRYEWKEKNKAIKPFSFEYSNRCCIYMNNSKIFTGNNLFLLKGPFYRGDIDKQMRANTVFLPVKKGKNVLYVAVSGINNGWGFMARFADASAKQE